MIGFISILFSALPWSDPQPHSKAILFWYRQSPQALQEPLGHVTLRSPPPQFPGEILIKLDSEGRLVSLSAIPMQEHSSPVPAYALDWEVFFNEAGLDYDQWTKDAAQAIPQSFADTRVAWKGLTPDLPGAPERVEAAAFAERPVLFVRIDSWNQEPAEFIPSQLSRISPGILIALVSTVLISVTILVGGFFFARKNLRLGRGDRRNAARLASIAAGLLMASLVLGAHHALDLSELTMLFIQTATSIVVGGLFWILYMALEPFVRRRWPQVLVGWTRLVSGDLRNPQVARDLLIGSAGGLLVIFLIDCLLFLFPSLASGSAEFVFQSQLNIGSAMGIRFFLSSLMGISFFSILMALLTVCWLYLLRILLRNQVVAAVVWVLSMALTNAGFFSPWMLVGGLVIFTLFLFILIRFGLAAMMFLIFTRNFFSTFPATFQASAWYASAGFASLAILAVMIIYAFRTSLGGRPIFGTPRLDD